MLTSGWWSFWCGGRENTDCCRAGPEGLLKQLTKVLLETVLNGRRSSTRAMTSTARLATRPAARNGTRSTVLADSAAS
jgi:hypothetical protein